MSGYIFGNFGSGSSGESEVLLWENPTPNQQLNSKLVTLTQPFSNFIKIRIEYKIKLSDNQPFYCVFPVEVFEYSGDITNKVSMNGVSAMIDSDVITRIFGFFGSNTVNGLKFQIFNAFSIEGTTFDDTIILTKIYGIK